MNKPFFRESNIWRLIGLCVLLAAGILAIYAPPVDAFQLDAGKAVTVPGIIALIGGLLLVFPTLKEGYITWKAPEKAGPEE